MIPAVVFIQSYRAYLSGKTPSFLKGLFIWGSCLSLSPPPPPPISVVVGGEGVGGGGIHAGNTLIKNILIKTLPLWQGFN